MTIEYVSVKPNTTPQTPPDLSKQIAIGLFGTLNNASIAAGQLTGINQPNGIGIVPNAVESAVPGLAQTLSGVNAFIANTEKPDFAKNLLGLIVGILLALIGISALLYEQSPARQITKRIAK